MKIKLLSGKKEWHKDVAKLPSFINVNFSFKTKSLPDYREKLDKEVSSLSMFKKLKPGARIAITAGSRGISNYPEILRIIGANLKNKGFNPFIVPSMGSHGGGTYRGRREILKENQITTEKCEMKIRGGKDYTSLGITASGVKVFIDEEALNADAVIVANRIKAHTDFESTHESGLAKMLVVGLGGPQGAEEIHRLGIKGLKEELVPAAKKIMSEGKLFAGIGIVENMNCEISEIRAFDGGKMIDKERELLSAVKKESPFFPFEELDLLVVRRMGKEISGTGMDTHIIGRKTIRFEGDFLKPRITRVAALDLTEESLGNCAGLGLADIITSRFFRKIDFDDFYFNTLTAAFIERAKIPYIAESDREAISVGIKSSWIKNPEKAKIAIIKDTLTLNEMSVSKEAFLSIKKRKEISGEGGFFELKFNKNGNLLS